MMTGNFTSENTIGDFLPFLRLIGVIVTLVFIRYFYFLCATLRPTILYGV